MPYVPHVRIVARFEIGPGSVVREQASCTLNFRVGDLPAPAPLADGDLQNLVNNAFDDWAPLLQNPDWEFLNAVKLVQTRGYWIGADGRMVGNPAFSQGKTPVSGTAIGSTVPFQHTMAVTLMGGARGPGRFGRVYLPPNQVTLQTGEGAMSQQKATTLLSAVRTQFEALSNRPSIDAGFALVVASDRGGGVNNAVTEIRLGRVPDTQRRRRRSLDEQYVAQPFAG